MKKRVYPSVGVGCIVLKEKSILLVRRLYPPQKGKWSVPGGHVELGESVLETARRELLEETGLKGVPQGVINVDEYVVKHNGRITKHYVLIDVLMKVENMNEMKAGSDAGDVKFFDLREAYMSKETAVTTRKLIEKILDKKVECLIKPLMSIVEE
jgi:8-oxo-dGTP diphosphatase